MLIKRLFQVAALMLLVIGTVLSGSAQEEFGREEVRPFVRVTIGTRTDNYIYYTPDQPDYNRVLDVLDTALPIYTTLTGLPWTTQIVIVYMGSAPTNLFVIGRVLENSTAYVTRLEPPRLFPDAESCHIRIYTGWESAPNLEALIARELFHCVQMSIGAVGILDFANPSYAWWRMGAAEWAASRVYPSQYPQAVHSIFDPRQDITTARLDAFYFWEFLASARGFGSDQNAITQMGVMRQGGLFPLNFGLDSTELFHSWAQVLLNRQLPIPPTVDLTNSDITAGRGGNLQTSMPRFAVDYKNFVAFDLQPGNIAFLRVGGMPAGHYAASIRTPNGLVRVQDDTPVQFCPSDDGTMLILSRGLGEIGVNVPLKIEWGQTASDTPCVEDQTEPDTGNCIVGSWLVSSYDPDDLDVAFAEIDRSGFVFNFDANGTLNGTYIIHASNPDGVRIDLNFAFSGNYQLRGIEATSHDYAVQTFTWDFEPNGFAELTARNGTITDMTTAFYDNSDLGVWSPDGSLHCENDVLSWESVGDVSFVLERQS